ncbi:MAG: hypothetical protein H6713_23355 [Myxococcales bacterium]|nr:hypothetical protein [Myxococcales bacterium]
MPRSTDKLSPSRAELVQEALELLLRGLEAATRRGGDEALEAALASGGELVYTSLLTALLRLLFALIVEARAGQVELRALHERLRARARDRPDELTSGFSAWPRALARVRLAFGETEDAAPRGGPLFDRSAARFLEGGAGLDAPRIDDGVVREVLERLLARGVPTIDALGDVYEALMGGRVERATGDSVRLRPHRVWVSVTQLRARPAGARARWLREQGLPTAQARALAAAVRAASLARAGPRGAARPRGRAAGARRAAGRSARRVAPPNGLALHAASAGRRGRRAHARAAAAPGSATRPTARGCSR